MKSYKWIAIIGISTSVGIMIGWWIRILIGKETTSHYESMLLISAWGCLIVGFIALTRYKRK